MGSILFQGIIDQQLGVLILVDLKFVLTACEGRYIFWHVLLKQLCLVYNWLNLAKSLMTVSSWAGMLQTWPVLFCSGPALKAWSSETSKHHFKRVSFQKGQLLPVTLHPWWCCCVPWLRPGSGRGSTGTWWSVRWRGRHRGWSWSAPSSPPAGRAFRVWRELLVWCRP